MAIPVLANLDPLPPPQNVYIQKRPVTLPAITDEIENVYLHHHCLYAHVITKSLKHEIIEKESKESTYKKGHFKDHRDLPWLEFLILSMLELLMIESVIKYKILFSFSF